MIYLDNSATSRKKPIGVYLAFIKETILSANPGRGGHRAAMRTAIKIEEVRQLLREWFFDGDVVFTKNCTEALNLAVCSIKSRKKVITTTSEHTSVLRPLKRMAKQGKITLKIVSPDYKEIMKELDSDTGMVVLGAVSNVTGKYNDVEKIARSVKEKSRAIVVVDGAQSGGKIRWNMDDVDMFCCSGHKGLHGLQGTGFLLVRRGLKLIPLMVGGTGNSSVDIDIPDDIPGDMEAGTVNSPGIIALGKGVKYTMRNMKKIKKNEDRYIAFLKDELSEMEKITIYSAQNGILLFNVKDMSCGEVADNLSARYGICVRSGLHCAPLMHKALGTLPDGAVRVSVGTNTRFWHLLYFVYALKKIIAGGTNEQ